MGTLPVVIATISICALLEKMCLSAGRCLSIWKIDESVERLEKQEEEDLAALFRALYIPKRFDSNSGPDLPDGVAFLPS